MQLDAPGLGGGIDVGKVGLGRGVGLAEGLGLDVCVGVVEGEQQGNVQPVGRSKDRPLGLSLEADGLAPGVSGVEEAEWDLGQRLGVLGLKEGGAPGPVWKLLLLEAPAPGSSCSWKLLFLEAPAPGSSCSWKFLFLEAPAPGAPAPWCSCVEGSWHREALWGAEGGGLPAVLRAIWAPWRSRADLWLNSWYSCSWCSCPWTLLILGVLLGVLLGVFFGVEGSWPWEALMMTRLERL